MFIDQKKNQAEAPIQDPYKQSAYHQPENDSKKTKVIISIVVAALAITGVSAFFLYRSLYYQPPTQPTDITDVPTTTTEFPHGLGDGNGDDNKATSSNIQAEVLAFGSFYATNTEEFTPSAKSYELPINIKINASNYYDVSRKLNLDPYVDDLNKYGFSISENPFGAEADDFYAFNQTLAQKDIPIAITSDFILYNYQNNLKEVYKSIEEQVFYEKLWDLYRTFYDRALARYLSKQKEVGVANDPILEGARLQVTYYAVALNLLKPTEDQIVTDANLTDKSKFTAEEAAYFSYSLPEILRESVTQEEQMIRYANLVQRSPIFFYQRDYSYFTVPAGYKNNAKLTNFYLAMRWANSLFPLYYISDECPDCLLDKEDWVIDMVAANYITKDFYEDQSLRNQWAVIYKFMSYFTGLRSDLTYLHYRQAMVDLFGQEYDIEKIFSRDNQNRDADLKKITDKILEYEFGVLEGEQSRTDVAIRKNIGMRMLQEPYWPNDYIFESLVGEDMVYNHEVSELNATACKLNRDNFYRCYGSGYDILGIIKPDFTKTESSIVNTSYDHYGERAAGLQSEIKKFEVFEWNSNIFWSTLDISKSLLGFVGDKYPPFVNSQGWEEKRIYNGIWGMWVNLHLPQDYLSRGFKTGSGMGFSTGVSCNEDNYIEPNLALVDELIAKNNMLLGMMEALGINKISGAPETKLINSNSDLNKIKEIIKKELSGQELDNEDCRFIDSYATGYTVVEEASKKFDANGHIMPKDLSDVKMMIVIYTKGLKNIISIGPLFNYEE